jgi:hypothetical protein
MKYKKTILAIILVVLILLIAVLSYKYFVMYYICFPKVAGGYSITEKNLKNNLKDCINGSLKEQDVIIFKDYVNSELYDHSQNSQEVKNCFEATKIRNFPKIFLGF